MTIKAPGRDEGVIMLARYAADDARSHPTVPGTAP